ncbi:hypothetical protein [Arcticibacter sp.]|jgi:hypothetical protein|uniref:hypothetical protein n=1 Tax=Arcticibacter sp. TaxID=1872630 RepID=UPI00388F70F0
MKSSEQRRLLIFLGPPDKFIPSIPDIGLIVIFGIHDKIVGIAMRAVASTACEVASGFPKAMLLKMESLKRMDFWLTKPGRVRKKSTFVFLISTSSKIDGFALWFDENGESSPSRLICPPEGPATVLQDAQ